MDTYTLRTQFQALQTTEENSAQLAEWGVSLDTFVGDPQWVIVPVGSSLPVAITTDADFQATYALVPPPTDTGTTDTTTGATA